MLKINRKIEYALIALKHMDSLYRGELVAAKEICSTYNTPFDPTSRVLQLMAQGGMLKAEQGARGGYQIRKDLSKVSFVELADMLGEPISFVPCFSRNSVNCEFAARCNIADSMISLGEKTRGFLKSMSLRDIIGS